MIQTIFWSIYHLYQNSRRVIIVFFRTREDERKTDSRTKTHTQHWILPRILALRPTFLRLRWNGWSASIKTKHEAVGRAINSNYREPCGRRKKLSTLLIHLVALLVFRFLAPQPAQSRSPSPPFSFPSPDAANRRSFISERTWKFRFADHAPRTRNFLSHIRTCRIGINSSRGGNWTLGMNFSDFYE